MPVTGGAITQLLDDFNKMNDTSSSQQFPEFNRKAFPINSDEFGKYTNEPILMGIVNHLHITPDGLGGMLGDFSFNGDEANPKEVCKACYKAFTTGGATDAAAKGICANIAVESNFNPNVMTWDGNGHQFGVGGGLCGFFRFGELLGLAKYAGISEAQLVEFDNKVRNSGLPMPTTACHSANQRHIMAKFGKFPIPFSTQLGYIVNHKQFQGVKSITDPSEATRYWMNTFEKPRDKPDRWAMKGNIVLQYLSS